MVRDKGTGRPLRFFSRAPSVEDIACERHEGLAAQDYVIKGAIAARAPVPLIHKMNCARQRFAANSKQIERRMRAIGNNLRHW